MFPVRLSVRLRRIAADHTVSRTYVALVGRPMLVLMSIVHASASAVYQGWNYG